MGRLAKCIIMVLINVVPRRSVAAKYAVAVLLLFNFHLLSATAPAVLPASDPGNVKYRWCGKFETVLKLLCDKRPDPANKSRLVHLDIDNVIHELEELYEERFGFVGTKFNGKNWVDVIGPKTKRYMQPGIVTECCIEECSLEYMRENYCES